MSLVPEVVPDVQSVSVLDLDGWVTAKDAAEMVGRCVNAVRIAAKRGRFKARKIANAWFFELESLRAYYDAVDEQGTNKHDPWRYGSRQRQS